VSRHAADLLAMGLVWQPPEPAQPSRPGRPRIPLDIDTSHHVAAGVHIDVSRLTFSLCDLRGRVVASEHVSRVQHPGAVLEQVAARLPGFLHRHASGRSVLGLGVVTGGWVDAYAGVLVVNAALGWRDVPLRRTLQRMVRLPVHVDGHAQALAHAEMLFGQVGEGILVHLFVGNAVDAAIATGGTLLRGRRHSADGIAHLHVPGSTQSCPCGRTGCLEVTVADRAIADRAAVQGVTPRPDLPMLLRAARDGDARAVELCRSRLRMVARMVARAVRPMLDVISPDAVVLTEAATLHLPQLLPALSCEFGAPAVWCGPAPSARTPSRWWPPCPSSRPSTRTGWDCARSAGLGYGALGARGARTRSPVQRESYPCAVAARQNSTVPSVWASLPKVGRANPSRMSVPWGLRGAVSASFPARTGRRKSSTRWGRLPRPSERTR
jgi:predicted NBD/HSP70 family sugar kinase